MINHYPSVDPTEPPIKSTSDALTEQAKSEWPPVPGTLEGQSSSLQIVSKRAGVAGKIGKNGAKNHADPIARDLVAISTGD